MACLLFFFTPTKSIPQPQPSPSLKVTFNLQAERSLESINIKNEAGVEAEAASTDQVFLWVKCFIQLFRLASFMKQLKDDIINYN